MGYSIRTGQWRYTEWRHNENGAVEARELYDLSTSPIETNNVVKAFPDMALALSRKIDQLLRQQIRLEVAPIL
jgi:iduronate 2-sulfatase